jgi:hypothetical protein
MSDKLKRDSGESPAGAESDARTIQEVLQLHVASSELMKDVYRRTANSDMVNWQDGFTEGVKRAIEVADNMAARAAESAGQTQPRAYPFPCGLCTGKIESEADLDWHGLGNCVPICERCSGSGQEPENKEFFITPAENAELEKLEKRGVKWIQSGANETRLRDALLEHQHDSEEHECSCGWKRIRWYGNGYAMWVDHFVGTLAPAIAATPPVEGEK